MEVLVFTQKIRISMGNKQVFSILNLTQGLQYFKQQPQNIKINIVYSKGNGGAISIDCSDDQDLYWCEYNLLSNDFKNNYALNGRGGALFYDIKRPIGLVQNSFSDNIALEWNDFSRPYNVLIPLGQNTKVQSGSKISFSIALIDQFDQIIDQDSKTILKISNYKPDSIRLNGNLEVKLEKGIAFFNNFTIISKPGSKATLEFSSDYFDKYSNSIQNKSLIIDFNVSYCINGQIIQNLQCVSCPQGFYTFENNSTKCKKCIENAICFGNNSLFVKPGYWRENILSEKIFPCLRYESCLGGFISQCAEGYKGKLCGQCSNNTKVYRKAGYTNCNLCLSKTQLLIYYLIWIIIMELYCIYIIKQLILKESRLKPSALFIRILINYVQTLRILLQLNLYKPNTLETSYKFLSLTTTYLESILSFDCLLWQFGYDLEQLELYRIQILIYGSLPIFLTTLNYGIIKLVQCVKKKNSAAKNGSRLKQINIKEIISQFFFILQNLFYQTIANLLMGMFNCIKLDKTEENSFLIFDLNVKCWRWENHISKVLPLAIIFGGYIIIYPIFIFFQIFKHRNNQNQIFRVYGVFLNGYKYEYYFWEVGVSFSWRILSITAVIFLPLSNIVVKCIILAIFVYTQVIIRKINQPFIDPLINSIDLHSQYSTLLIMIIFLIENWFKTSETLFFALHLIAVVYNFFFFLIWLFHWIKCAIQWDLVYLRRFRLFNWVLARLNKSDMLTYIEQMRISNSNINIYLDTSSDKKWERRQQYTQEERINNQISLPESSRKILQVRPSIKFTVQELNVRRTRTRIFQADNSSAI